MRTNTYKEKILKVLTKKHLLTIAQLHEAIPEADYSTIFRNIEQLHKDKLIKKIVIGNKINAYELAHEDHGHFVCDDCGNIEAVDISISKNKLKNKTINDITFRGVCGKCEN